MLAMRVEDVSNPRVELVLDAIGEEFGEFVRMPDCFKSMRCVQRDCPMISWLTLRALYIFG